MTSRGADWYRREPRAFLEGIRQLSEREIAVYAVVLDLIYDGGHQTLNDPKHIASYFSDLGSAAVRHAIGRLIESGKLIAEGDFLTNKRAQNEGKTREELAENRRKAGHLGGVSSGVSRAEVNKSNDLGEADAPYVRALDKIREEDTEKEEPKGSSKKRGSRIPEDFLPDLQFAEQAGLNQSQARSEADKFRDYWNGVAGAKGVKLDWAGTWRNWVRGAAERLPRARGAPPGRHADRPDPFKALAKELQSEPARSRRRDDRNRDDAQGLPILTIEHERR